MAVKAREKASHFMCGTSEVNCKHSSAGLQNPAHFAGALLACFPSQMMQHHRGQDSVKRPVRERHLLDNCISKVTSTPAFFALPRARAIISGDASIP